MYKAVFIDVDGTLIRSDHSISNATVDTIQKLKEKNILVVLVSARPLSGIVTIAEKIGLLNNPLVSLNGSYISIEGSIVFNSIIKNGVSNSVHEQLQKYNSTIIYYQQTQWFSEFKNNNTDYEQEITSVPVKIQSLKKTLQYWYNNNTGANKILVISPERVINKIQDDLKQQFINDVNIYTSKSTYLEVINKQASKVNAIKLLMARFNVKREETIAIGDNFNDKEMIEFAGIGIAMGNAPEEVKAIADYKTDTNNNNGVSKALNEIIGSSFKE